MTQPPTALSVNLNKIALLRNSREGNYPSVVEHANVCLAAGADGITVHPRPDQRHIRPGDVMELSELLRPLSRVEFNVEGNPLAPAQSGPRGLPDYPGFMALVDAARPEQCTLVPDTDSQLTSDHGFDLTQSTQELESIIQQLRDWNCRVCLFMDPDIKQIQLAAKLGVDRIELYTGPYALAHRDKSPQLQALFDRYRDAAQAASELGLGVNAGHDLNLENLPQFRSIPGLLEVSIGHALTVDALHLGLAETVKRYRLICQN